MGETDKNLEEAEATSSSNDFNNDLSPSITGFFSYASERASSSVSDITEGEINKEKIKYTLK